MKQLAVEREWVLKTAKNLGHSDWKVREKAVRALGWSKHPDAVLPLAKVMRNDNRVSLRKAALEELTGYGPDVLPVVEKAFQDDDYQVREKAAGGLVRIGNKAIPLLGKVLQEERTVHLAAALDEQAGHVL